MFETLKVQYVRTGRLANSYPKHILMLTVASVIQLAELAVQLAASDRELRKHECGSMQTYVDISATQ